MSEKGEKKDTDHGPIDGKIVSVNALCWNNTAIDTAGP
jgi:hypothetical protein